MHLCPNFYFEELEVMDLAEGVKNSAVEAKKSVYYAKLSGDVKRRYEEKIKKCNGIDPYTLDANDLSRERKDFPNICVSDIANYMICSISPFTNQTKNAYKSTESYRYFDSGFVLDIGTKTINSTVILIGKVKHSQKMNDAPLHVWLLANMDGKIDCAHCTCVAGLSETCSHIGAICYAVTSICESSSEKSVTEILCKWNVPSFKNVSMRPAIDIDWRIPTQEAAPPESSFRSRCESITHFTDARINEFIKKCNSNNDEEVQEISRITLPQLKSKFYVGLQRGRITGSNLMNCCKASITDPCIATINRLINPTMLDNVPNMKYHNKNKRKAIDQYIRNTAPNHNDFQYGGCGLIFNQKFPYFAASPDGLVNCDCHGDGCILVKCLKILSSGASLDVLTSKPNNILNKHENEYLIEENHEFFFEIQLQIHLVELEFCDFVIWSPNYILQLRIFPDKDFWNAALEKASRFHERFIMPELLGKFYTKNADMRHSVDDSCDEESNENLEVIALKIQLLD